MDSGSIGSRIVFCKFSGTFFNIVVVGVYIPQKKRKKPDQKDIYDKLEAFLMKISDRDCIILLGDFNSRLPRDTDGRVGHWCIHKNSDTGGDRLLEIMNRRSLRCVSTYFQPRRNHSNATYINIQPEKPPSQIDYIIVSSRWSSSARSCSTKWGISIASHGRKYDHGLVVMSFKSRLKCDRRSERKDFSSLKCEEISIKHNRHIERSFAETERPTSANEKWNRFVKTMQSAQTELPAVKRTDGRKWQTSDTTKELVKNRSDCWQGANEDDRKKMTTAIKRSARQDYRDFVDSIVEDVEKCNRSGNTREMFRLAKSLTSKGNGSRFTQPTTDNNGDLIISSDQQLESWASFLEEKFKARPNEPEVFIPEPNSDENITDLTLEEVEDCMKSLKSNKACGPDTIPVEQYKSSDAATNELYDVLLSIWQEESIPDDFALGDMMMHYKKKCSNDRRNYRALGLLNHAYKIFAKTLLERMLPFITPKISDMQAGFRKERGCRDNILILVTAIRHILMSSDDDIKSQGIITYIDFTAAFDSISHSYLLNALQSYGVPAKYCRLIQAIYNSAAVRVRIQGRDGSKNYSRNVSVKRGVIQGDIPSPVCFLVALDKIMKEHGGLDTGIQLNDYLLLSELLFADDAALPNDDANVASRRLTHLDKKAREEAGMDISKPKTKVQHVMKRPRVSATTEDDVANLPDELKFKFVCEKCEMSYPTKHGLSVHQGRHCKGRKTAKKPSRKGTVADRIVTRLKIEEFQKSLDKVSISDEELENVYKFVYLGAAVAGDGDPEVTVQNRINIAWGSFNDYRKCLTSTKLPIRTRIRLYRSLVVTPMTHASDAWIFTTKMKQKINGVNSKMLSQITKRTIHEEARQPSFNIVTHVLNRRWVYLGHILRLDQHRALKKFLIQLSPKEQPFLEGSLFADTTFRTIDEMLEAAANRKLWKDLNPYDDDEEDEENV